MFLVNSCWKVIIFIYILLHPISTSRNLVLTYHTTRTLRIIVNDNIARSKSLFPFSSFTSQSALPLPTSTPKPLSFLPPGSCPFLFCPCLWAAFPTRCTKYTHSLNFWFWLLDWLPFCLLLLASWSSSLRRIPILVWVPQWWGFWAKFWV